MFQQLRKTEEYARVNEMKINKKKTKLMLFNPYTAIDFMAEISLDGQQLEVVEEMKIVGFILRSDLKTVSNYIIGKAYARIWIVQSLKALGASRVRLLNVLQKQVLSVLQLAVPAWDCFLTCQERTNLERVLKTGLRITLHMSKFC